MKKMMYHIPSLSIQVSFLRAMRIPSGRPSMYWIAVAIRPITNEFPIMLMPSRMYVALVYLSLNWTFSASVSSPMLYVRVWKSMAVSTQMSEPTWAGYCWRLVLRSPCESVMTLEIS